MNNFLKYNKTSLVTRNQRLHVVRLFEIFVAKKNKQKNAAPDQNRRGRSSQIDQIFPRRRDVLHPPLPLPPLGHHLSHLLTEVLVHLAEVLRRLRTPCWMWMEVLGVVLQSGWTCHCSLGSLVRVGLCVEDRACTRTFQDALDGVWGRHAVQRFDSGQHSCFYNREVQTYKRIKSFIIVIDV